MKKKIIYNVLICFCLCGFICSSLGIYYNYKEDQRDAILALEGQVEKENINDYEKEIKKLQEKFNAITILIKNKRVETQKYENKSDDNVNNYNYN